MFMFKMRPFTVHDSAPLVWIDGSRVISDIDDFWHLSLLIFWSVQSEFQIRFGTLENKSQTAFHHWETSQLSCSIICTMQQNAHFNQPCMLQQLESCWLLTHTHTSTHTFHFSAFPAVIVISDNNIKLFSIYYTL